MKKKKIQNKIIINFNKNFYNLKVIKNAIKAYKKLANFMIETNKRYIKVEIECIDKEIESLIKDEFCNYVLSEMKNLK